MKSSYKAILEIPGQIKELPCTVTFNENSIYLHSNAEGFPISIPVSTITHADFITQGILILNYGTYPYSILRIYAKEALQDFQRTYPRHPLSAKLSKSSGKTMGILALSVLLSIIGLLLLFYFFLLPLFAGWAATKVSPEFERSLGKQMHLSYLQTEKEDTSLSRIATNFFKSFGYEKSDSVVVTVIDSKEVNAFALPGGFIFLPKGMIAELKTPGQLAALLSHEFVHARNKHSLRSMIASASGRITLMILLGGIDDSVITLLMSSSDDLRNLSFSRDLESESDRVGMELMAQHGINPKEMIALLEILSKQVGVEAPAFLSTHPVFEDRIPEAKKIAQQLKIEGIEKIDKRSFDQLKQTW
jgi:beta-barrel assembly-enhancing protease